LALTWLLHLIGDLHQPLHTTALYAVDLFPTGDRGGNDVGVRGATNLHALWDGALGNDRRWTAVTRHAEGLQVSAMADRPVDFAAWAMASRDLAAEIAYSPTVRSAITGGAPGHPVVLRIDAAYRASMQSAARTQAALAATRTALVVAEIFGGSGTANCGG
jgi:hypothetical protein